MLSNERDYNQVVNTLAPVLHNLPGRIVAIDGLPGVGKTTLGRFLAYRFNVALIETDLFLIPRLGRMIYMNDEVGRIISSRVDGCYPRPVIVEGAAILRLMAEVNRNPDFVIYVANKHAPESHGELRADLEAYDAQFSPRQRADLTIDFDHSG